MTTADRRLAPRHRPVGDEPWSRVRLRDGRELTVVDASAGGLLVEGEVRLLPGTHLDLHLITMDGRLLVRTRILRAHVVRLAGDGVTYRGALAFERSFELHPDGYRLPAAARSGATHTRTLSPERAA